METSHEISLPKTKTRVLNKSAMLKWQTHHLPRLIRIPPTLLSGHKGKNNRRESSRYTRSAKDKYKELKRSASTKQPKSCFHEAKNIKCVALLYTTVETIMYSVTKSKADIVIAHSHDNRHRNDFYNATPSQPSPFQATLDSHL